jgi:hypothetical protein
MSSTLFSGNLGSYKKGNGGEFMVHLEQVSQKKIIENIKPSLNTRNNLYYTKLRDDIEAKCGRLRTFKDKEIEA